MIILASNSQWRAQLLSDWGFDFEVKPTDTDEEQEKNSITDPKNLVETLALKKYQACHNQYPDHIILAADTVVAFNNQIIGKPLDRQDAKHIISSLAGQTHQVWTGVCINGEVFSEVSNVTFAPMNENQLEAYLDTNEWQGKAGGYQVQKSIKPYVKAIDGDINTVIGLPQKTQEKLILVQNSSHNKS